MTFATTCLQKGIIQGYLDKSLRNLANTIYIDIFYYKNGNFQWKNLDIFLIFAQSIDCGKAVLSTPAYPSLSIYI